MEHWLGWFMDGNDQVREIALAAERMGFTGIALVDHVALPPGFRSEHPSGKRQIEHDSLFGDPLITAATMAGATSTLRFMTYIYVLPMRDPFTVAKQVTTVSMQTGYRFTLGVGAGWNAEEFALLGHDFATRGRRMDEMLAVMRGLWEQGTFAYRGDFYDFGPASQYPVPAQRLPILVGGSSPAALRRAARHDGWLGMMEGREAARRIAAVLDRERAERVGRGEAQRPLRKLVVPESDAQHAELEDLGYDGVIAWCWNSQDPRAAPSLQAKLDVMHAYAAKHLGA